MAYSTKSDTPFYYLSSSIQFIALPVSSYKSTSSSMYFSKLSTFLKLTSLPNASKCFFPHWIFPYSLSLRSSIVSV